MESIRGCLSWHVVAATKNKDLADSHGPRTPKKTWVSNSEVRNFPQAFRWGVRSHSTFDWLRLTFNVDHNWWAWWAFPKPFSPQNDTPKMFVGDVFDGQNAPQVALQALQLAGPTWTPFGGVLVRQMKGTQDVVSTFDLQKHKPNQWGV